MANVKAGVMGVIVTVILVILEYILFPIALNFQSTLNSSAWVSASDRTLLANNSTLMIVVIIMTLVGGLLASVYFAVKGQN